MAAALKEGATAMETLIGRGKMNTYLIAANKIAQVLRDTPRENKAHQAYLLYTLMVLLDEARQLAGQDHAEVTKQ